MREFAFTVTYERGADELMDVFIDHPDLSSRTVSCHATAESMWRVDEVTGPEEALAAYDAVLAGLTRCSNLRGMGGCTLDWRYEVLEETPTSRLIYSQQSEGPGCRSIPYLVADHLGDGVLIHAEQHGNEYVWRVLAADDAALSAVYDELERHLREGLSIDFDHVERATNWSKHGVDDVGLSPKQRAALELAVEHGYYEQPRRHSLQEIAQLVDIPTSTLQYRLTSAERHVVESFIDDARFDPASTASAASQ
ncbi:hypothetical protein J2754_000376 [Halarchaeum solikamskense]|uniref:helix-turn-helix domain-containing protein n=1 Tax=Halarchaeum nitratireducens TaxID=489913 RepID=UPI001B3ACB39|nr:helix-turn-helix domain-containing protein [Halarchaeum solikamskense]MBP2250079.1 hypothetical protein [Halarchaeum solikamskense]